MWYWDYIPSHGNHQVKPLSKSELKKLQEQYAKADIISEHVRQLEQEEKKKNKDHLEKSLDSLFL